MNAENYRWLRGYLQQLPPEQFDYGHDSLGEERKCGCVAWHVCVSQMSSMHRSNAHWLDLQLFLNVTSAEASQLYKGRSSSDDLDYMEADWKGEAGIRRAIQCLDEIAASYGLTPEPSTSQPAFTPDADAFLAKLRDQIAQPMVSAVNR